MLIAQDATGTLRKVRHQCVLVRAARRVVLAAQDQGRPDIQMNNAIRDNPDQEFPAIQGHLPLLDLVIHAHVHASVLLNLQ